MVSRRINDMKTELRQYKDVAGNPCSLDWLVRNEPEWAANQIRHRDKLDAENKTLKEALDAIANMPEYDQDDAHRLRNIARRAAESANAAHERPATSDNQ
jgi:hypothetical protein